MPNNHETHGSPAQTPDSVFDGKTPDEIYSYVGQQRNRLGRSMHDSDITLVSDADNSGHSVREQIVSLPVFQYALDRSSDFEWNGDVISDDEKLALHYINTVIAKNEAVSLIDREALAHKYSHYATTFNGALDQHLKLTATDELRVAGKLQSKLDSGVNSKTDELTEEEGRDKEELGRIITAKKGMARDATVARRMPEETQDFRANTEQYFAELIQRRLGDPRMSDDELSDARIELHKQLRQNLRIARAYIRVARDVGTGTDVQGRANVLLREVEDMADEDHQRVTTRYAYGREEIIPDTIDLTSTPDDLDDEQRDSVAVSSDTAPTGDSMSDARADSSSTAPNDAPGVRNRTSQNNTPQAPEQHRLNLEAAQARYAASMQDLALSSARRGNRLFSNERDDAQAQMLQKNLSDAIRELMEVEHPEYINDTTIDKRQQGALINAYYVSKRAELSKQSAELMARGSFSKFNKFVLKHKVAIGIGATVFGGLLGGGVGGAIAGKAMSSALTSYAKKTEQGIQDFAGTIANSGESQREIDAFIEQQRRAGQAVDYTDIARIAGLNLHDQFEHSVEGARKSRQKAALGAAAVGVAVWAGGHMMIDGLHYAWNGEGGLENWITNYDNPNGDTMWRPITERPWWMNSATPWALGTAGAAGLAIKKYRKDKKKQSASRRNYGLAA